MSDPRLVPEETALTAPYWQGVRSGELRIQRCTECELALHPPQPICPRCHSSTLEWSVASGAGTVHAVTIVEHAAHPAVSQWVPYTVLLIRLDEGPLLITGPARDPSEPNWPIGTRVKVKFDPIPGTDVVLPYVVPESG